MTLKELKARVQELGELRQKVNDLQAAEKQLGKIVRTGLNARKNGHVESADFMAQLAERRTLTVNPAKLRRKTEKMASGDATFLQCIKVDLKAARRHFSDRALERLGKVTTGTPTLRISRKPKKGS